MHENKFRRDDCHELRHDVTDKTPMSWQDAKAAAETIAETLPRDLKGKSLQVTDFVTEDDCRAFYPDRPLGFHRMILSAVRKLAWKRGTHLIVPVLLRASTSYLKLDQDARTDLANRSFMALDIDPKVSK